MGLPCGASSETYDQDMAIFRTRMHWCLLASLLVLLITFPFLVGSLWLSILSITFIWIIGALGLNILVGLCGQISLGHAAFVGVGAFTSAIVTTKLGLSFWIAFPCAVVVTGLVGLAFGLPSLRVKGFYLAMATLAAQFILSFIFLHWTSMTGGWQGIGASRPHLAGIVISDERSWYYLILAFTLLATFLAKNVARTRAGRAFVAIRDNDLAAEVMGINLFGYKLLAFFLASCFAGAAGSLIAHYMGNVQAEQFPLIDSIWYLGMIIIGGLGSTSGVIFGVMFIKLLTQAVDMFVPALAGVFPALSGALFAAAGQIVFALALVLFLIFEPRGIAHRWELTKASYRLWPFSY